MGIYIAQVADHDYVPPLTTLSWGTPTYRPPPVLLAEHVPAVSVVLYRSCVRVKFSLPLQEPSQPPGSLFTPSERTPAKPCGLYLVLGWYHVYRISDRLCTTCSEVTSPRSGGLLARVLLVCLMRTSLTGLADTTSCQAEQTRQTSCIGPRAERAVGGVALRMTSGPRTYA